MVDETSRGSAPEGAGMRTCNGCGSILSPSAIRCHKCAADARHRSAPIVCAAEMERAMRVLERTWSALRANPASESALLSYPGHKFRDLEGKDWEIVEKRPGEVDAVPCAGGKRKTFTYRDLEDFAQANYVGYVGEKLSNKSVIVLSNSLGLSRDELPQITSDQRAAFLEFVRSRGYSVSPGEMAVKLLRPVQRELNPEKVAALKAADTPSLSVISSDGYILDGHHRWYAMLETNPDSQLKVWQVAAPISKLLSLARAFPGAEFKGVKECVEAFCKKCDKAHAPVCNKCGSAKGDFRSLHGPCDKCAFSEACEEVTAVEAINKPTRATVADKTPNPAKGPTRAHGSYRFRVGANRAASPRKDVAMSVRNRANARRGLATRIRAAKKWHKSVAGQDYHSALSRYNRGNNRGNNVSESDLAAAFSAALDSVERTVCEAVSDTTPAYSPSTIDPESRSIDDIFDGLLRRLISIESVDVLQDAEFTDEGDIILFFDPGLDPDEVEEILRALQQENPAAEVVDEPGSGESQWWVILSPSEPAQPDMQAIDNIANTEVGMRPGDSELPKNQMTVMAPIDVDRVAKGVDTSKLVQGLAESKRRSGMLSRAVEVYCALTESTIEIGPDKMWSWPAVREVIAGASGRESLLKNLDEMATADRAQVLAYTRAFDPLSPDGTVYEFPRAEAAHAFEKACLAEAAAAEESVSIRNMGSPTLLSVVCEGDAGDLARQHGGKAYRSPILDDFDFVDTALPHDMLRVGLPTALVEKTLVPATAGSRRELAEAMLVTAGPEVKFAGRIGMFVREPETFAVGWSDHVIVEALRVGGYIHEDAPVGTVPSDKSTAQGAPPDRGGVAKDQPDVRKGGTAHSQDGPKKDAKTPPETPGEEQGASPSGDVKLPDGTLVPEPVIRAAFARMLSVLSTQVQNSTESGKPAEKKPDEEPPADDKKEEPPKDKAGAAPEAPPEPANAPKAPVHQPPPKSTGVPSGMAEALAKMRTGVSAADIAQSLLEGVGTCCGTTEAKPAAASASPVNAPQLPEHIRKAVSTVSRDEEVLEMITRSAPYREVAVAIREACKDQPLTAHMVAEVYTHVSEMAQGAVYRVTLTSEDRTLIDDAISADVEAGIAAEQLQAGRPGVIGDVSMQRVIRALRQRGGVEHKLLATDLESQMCGRAH